MRIYLAGGQPSWREQLERRHLLVSFAEKQQLKIIDAGCIPPGILLDCGAFTAWTKGRPVDLEQYIAYVQSKAHLLAGYFALDVIPGEPLRMPTKDEALMATEQTLSNLDRMMAEGLRPIPIYHEGEPDEVLQYYIRQGHELIGLGATASRGRPELIDWLLPIFERYPGQRFHGLAMTQTRLIKSLPFYSVDSTSWLNFARYGLEANKYLLKGRTASFMRQLGAMAFEDLASVACHEDALPSKDGQLALLPWSEIA